MGVFASVQFRIIRRITRLYWDPQTGSRKNIAGLQQVDKDLGSYIPVTFLLSSWGSPFAVLSPFPLKQRPEGVRGGAAPVC